MDFTHDFPDVFPDGYPKFVGKRFWIECKIAEGTYASLYKAHISSQLVAVKEIFMPRNEPITSLRVQEIESLKRLSTHTNIARYGGHFIEKSLSDARKTSLYIVTEYSHITLLKLIKLEDLLITKEAIRSILKQLLYALVYAQSFNIIHRHIKPGNILITHDGVLKLVEWGRSKDLNETTSRPKVPVGETSCYAPPEALLQLSAGSTWDVWSAACVVAETASRQVLFHGKSLNTQLATIFQSCSGYSATQFEPYTSIVTKYIVLEDYPIQNRALMKSFLGEHITDNKLVSFLAEMLIMDDKNRPEPFEVVEENTNRFAKILYGTPSNIKTTVSAYYHIIRAC